MKTKTKIIIFATLAVSLGVSVTMPILAYGKFNKQDWAILGNSIKWDYDHKEDSIKVDIGKYGVFFVPISKTLFMPSNEYSVSLKWCEYDTSFFSRHEKEPIRLVITFEATPYHI